MGEIGNLNIQSGKIQEFGYPEWENLEFRHPERNSLRIWDFGHPEWDNLGILASRVGKIRD